MDCKGYRSYMWPYLKDELDDKKIYNLLDHVYACSDCKNELKTQFLVSEGIKRLENGNYGFNLLSEYEAKLEASMARCRNIKLANMIIASSGTLLVTFVAVIIVLSLLF